MFKTTAILLLSAAATGAAAQRPVTAGAASGSSAGSTSTSPASLLVTGHVTVDQHPVTNSTSTIFAGDSIQTASSSAARISAAGLSLYLPSNSCLKYGGEQFELCSCGSVDVNAMRQVSIIFRDRELVVSSQEQNSAFTLSVLGNDLELVNRRGVTEIAKSGSILAKLGPGVSRSFAGLGCTTSVGGAATVAAGPVALMAAPAMITTAVIKADTNRSTISSFKP